MTSGTALPLMIGHIVAEGYGSILHSYHHGPMGKVALSGVMKDHGLVPEAGRIWLSTRAVCRFYTDIGMSMRSGTSSISKKPQPSEAASLRNIMKLRLLFCMVTHSVVPQLVFQIDETGVSLLPFSKRGRAQAGVSEVLWHGWDEKRQFTVTPIIDGEGKVIQPSQMIWGGQEYKKVGGVFTSERLNGACPKPEVRAKHQEQLYHEQSNSHWCTIGTLKILVQKLYEHTITVCEALGLDVATQVFILVLDCYAVHIGEEFLAWCALEYPTLFLLFIPANCTAWLQPLDISFNSLFKRMLRQLAGEWLANYMRQQLLQVTDPTKVKLNISLTALKPHFTSWVAEALAEVNKQTATIMRGWEESGMGEAMRLAQQGKESEEFQVAARMHSNGELFEKFTMKKAADLAEKMLAAQQQQFFKEGDLHGDAVAATIEYGPAGEASAAPPEGCNSEQYVWHEPEYAAMLDTIRNHFTTQQNITFVDGTATPSKKQKR